MQVGILTFHYSNNNYGAVLQAYSIYKLIESLGHKSYIIDYKPPRKGQKEHIYQNVLSILGLNFGLFRKRHIPRQLKLIKDADHLKALNSCLDAFVVGSDQVWRYREDIESLFTYYLDFVNDEKVKLAYAASFGVDYWNANAELTQNLANLTKRFKAISIRESSGICICKNHLHRDASLVLDPTLVVDKKVFSPLLKQHPVIDRKFLGYMLLDQSPHAENIIECFAKFHRMPCINLKGIRVSTKQNLFIYRHVSKWIRLIKDAEAIITDSFHCTVFAILFHKPFLCIPNHSRGLTRITNLLSLIGLEHRLVSNIDDIYDINIFDCPNYDLIDEILQKERLTSISFLTDNLS